MNARSARRVGDGTVILLRHGESTGNAADEFTGWRDVPLTQRGRAEASNAGQLLSRHGIRPDTVHTSVLARAIDTATLVLAQLDFSSQPRRASWRLNERHYGALQGRLKADVRAEVGHDTYLRWRRSYTGTPPPLAVSDPAHPARDQLYAAIPPDALPGTESLADVTRRLLPHWHDVIAADIAVGATPLVVAHGNSLRALVMHLDDLSPVEIEDLNLPTGIPLRYDLSHWRPRNPGGTYLDPAAAEAGITAVAAQDGT